MEDRHAELLRQLDGEAALRADHEPTLARLLREARAAIAQMAQERDRLCTLWLDACGSWQVRAEQAETGLRETSHTLELVEIECAGRKQEQGRLHEKIETLEAKLREARSR